MKRHAPAAERNREPILEVLRKVLPARGTILEIASGTGQHAAAFAAGLPELTWQPSDLDPDNLESIAAWLADSAIVNARDPVIVDAARPDSWPIEGADGVVNINMIHISPWSACRGLVRGAASVLPPGGPLCLYGPFFVEGRTAAPSNLSFDASLRSRNPSWGVRWLHDVEAEAAAAGFALEEVVDMPANNVVVVLRRGAS